MSEQEKMPTWLEIFKGMPAYTAENFRLFVAYWREASLRMWVAETLWLIILVSMFYFGVHFIVDFYEGTTINPHSGTGWFISFLPLYFVAAIFIAHKVFATLVKAIFMWLDGRDT